tara:strand:- start:300 stop:521 length:222 start_codon:yes stop_codon:yes gene_type:complete
MSTVVHKVEADLKQRLKQSYTDGSSIDQVLTDLAVIVLSNMRPHEVDAALYMSLGHQGVADLLASRATGVSND